MSSLMLKCSIHFNDIQIKMRCCISQNSLRRTQLDLLFTFLSHKHHNDKTWRSEKWAFNGPFPTTPVLMQHMAMARAHSAIHFSPLVFFRGLMKWRCHYCLSSEFGDPFKRDCLMRLWLREMVSDGILFRAPGEHSACEVHPMEAGCSRDPGEMCGGTKISSSSAG